MSKVDVRKTLKRRDSIKKERERSRKMIRTYPKVMMAGFGTFDKEVQTQTDENVRERSVRNVPGERISSKKSIKRSHDMMTQKRDTSDKKVSTS
jgi:hypothetical protein